MQATQEQLIQLVNRIVDAVHPLRIILFGSATRGEMGPDSDVDVMVVMPNGTHRRDTAMYLHQCMLGMGIAVDFVVATPAVLEKYKDTRGLIYRNIIREGMELYAA